MMRAIATCAVLTAALLTGCREEEEPDAYGNMEATEVVVGSESSGQLLWFSPEEGAQLGVGTIVGVIDTAQIALEVAQVVAQRVATLSRAEEVAQQIDALEVQREIARRAFERTARLFAQQAATAPQLDQAERDARVLSEQIEGARAQRQTILRDAASGDARVAQARDRIRKSRLVNPQAGTVLTSYAKAGEVVQPGQPLYKIADLSSMILRAYITEPQLAQVKLGQPVQVSIDVAQDERRVLSGTVSWIASKAEFAPTPIETRDERVDLVYAVKIVVPNPGGVLKIGMPADVRFTAAKRS